MKTTYKNRYGDEFSFSKTEDGNVLWEGDFTYCRIGYPNDYSKAYNAYLHDHKHVQDLMSFNQFKNVVHEYDDETHTHIYDKYLKMVESLKDKINMVDPSGGPYLAEGMNLKTLDPTFKKMIIKEFQPVDTGYKIIIQ